MTLQRLSTGYWHASWSPMLWAQWPVGCDIQRKDFFQPSWAYTQERAEEATAAVDAALTALGPPRRVSR